MYYLEWLEGLAVTKVRLRIGIVVTKHCLSFGQGMVQMPNAS